jgi:hypothetical protein
METPVINRKRASFVLGRIDEILSWDRAKEQEKGARYPLILVSGADR